MNVKRIVKWLRQVGHIHEHLFSIGHGGDVKTFEVMIST
jgi:hypothetical protein